MRRIHLLHTGAAVFLALTLAAVLAPHVADAGGGCHEPTTDARGTTVDLKELCIIPGVVRVERGQAITWVNRDAMAHTVTGAGIRAGDGLSWGSLDELAAGQAYTHVFDRDGIYPYFCWLHPGMVGAVVVGDANAAAFPATAGGAIPTAAAQSRAASHTSAGVTSRPAIIALLALGSVVLVAAALVGAGSLARRRGMRA